MYRATPQQVPTSKTSIYGAAKHTHTGDEIVNNPIDLSTDGDIWVNGARVDEYEANGSYGRPFKTITEAMDVAESGNTVKVAPGDYDEEITIPTGVNLVGLGNLAVRVTSLRYTGGEHIVINNIFVDYDLPDTPATPSTNSIFYVLNASLINCKSNDGAIILGGDIEVTGCHFSYSHRTSSVYKKNKLIVHENHGEVHTKISNSTFISDESEGDTSGGNALQISGGCEKSSLVITNSQFIHRGDVNIGTGIFEQYKGSLLSITNCMLWVDFGYAFHSGSIPSQSYISTTLLDVKPIKGRVIYPYKMTDKKLVYNGQDYSNAPLELSDANENVFIKSNSGARDYILPYAQAGNKFRFLWTANVATATTITTAVTTDSTGDMLRGGLLVCAAAGVNTFVEASGDVNKMTFDDDLPNSAAGIGSWVQVECVENGIWLVTGVLNSTTDPDSNGSAIFSDVD